MSDAHNSLQFRDLPLARVELKFAGGGNGKPLRFSGMASTYGDEDFNGDTVLPGAFAETLDAANRTHPVYMFKQHNPAMPIGKWLELKDTDAGLAVEGELTPGNSDADNTAASLKHGAVGGLSIGFIPKPGGALQVDEDHRILKAVDLFEISVTTMNANAGARVLTIKSMIDQMNSLSSAEELLRDAVGCTRTEAKAFVAKLRRIQPANEANVEDETLLRDAVGESLSELCAMTNIALFKLGSLAGGNHA